MKIAIIGTGNVGSILGIRWAKNGHQIAFGSRTPDNTHAESMVERAGPNAIITTPKDAASDAEIVVLATKCAAVNDVIKQLGNLNGKIIIDPNNPIKEDFSGLFMGTSTSVAEEIASLLPYSTVIKAFNMTGVDNMANPVYDKQNLTMCICGDNEDAKLIVAGLAQELDFEVVDCGALTSARYLEPMAMLWIALVRDVGMGKNIGFRLLKK